jgi:hypothetical protein
MQARFENINIDGLLNDRCYAVDGPILRLYFKLSSTPPLGWAYLFTQVWHSLDYPDKCRAGMEGDTLWIECAPDEVHEKHMWPLEFVLEQTNERYFREYLQSPINEDGQRELSRQTHMKLDELAKSLRPDGQHAPTKPSKKSPLGKFFGKILSAPARNGSGDINGGLMHWKARRFVVPARADG